MDSYGHAISRDNFLSDLKYLTFGFSFLQESINKILIEAASGYKYLAGLFAQQEPYKCVMVDRYDFISFSQYQKIQKSQTKLNDLEPNSFSPHRKLASLYAFCVFNLQMKNS